MSKKTATKTKVRPPSKKRPLNTEEGIAARIADAALLEATSSLNAVVAWGEADSAGRGELWERLMKMIDGPGERQMDALDKEMSRLLPDNLQTLFCEYSDCQVGRLDAAQEAGYLVGVQVGLRMAKGGR